MKRSRIKPRRSSPRRREAPRWTTEEWGTANALLLLRCGYSCECCGEPLSGRMERHHRQRRRDGGDTLANLLALLPEHHAHWTAHPAEAIKRGIIVPTWADPATTPVLWCGHELSLLADDGTREPVTQ